MSKLKSFAVGLGVASAICAGAAAAAPSSKQLCQKIIEAGRGIGQSVAQCQCSFRVADAVLDDDIKELMFDSWYTGANNMAALEKLRPKNRVKKQLRTYVKSLNANCLI